MLLFECILLWLVYILLQDKVEVIVDFDLELVVCSVLGKGSFLVCFIWLEDVGVEYCGKGCNQCWVYNILLDSVEVDCLLVVEVYIDEGVISLWLLYKYDIVQLGKEMQLEEIYYYCFDLLQGFVFQWVYIDDCSLDVCMVFYNYDVVMVLCGYYLVVVIVGYDSYYLNVMVGLDWKWLFIWEDDYVWINMLEYLCYD